MPSLQQLLALREGYEKKVYLDSLKKPTVGIGHLVVPADKLKVGDEIDDRRITELFRKDSAKAVAAARKQAGQAGINSPDFIVYLASVNFQLGPRWHMKFKKTWALIVAGDYETAAQEIMKSRWAKQTPVRAKDFRKALLKLSGKAPKGEKEAKSATA